MSLRLRKLLQESTKKKLNRNEILALMPEKKYDDGRTDQCFKNECNIQKIMARYNRTGTKSHLAKFEGVYADFSEFDFHKQQNMLTRGETIFNELPAEVRREFGQSAAAFFAYVNDPKNAKDLRKKLPALAKPGDQLPAELDSADLETRIAALEKKPEPISAKATSTGSETVRAPEAQVTPVGDG